MARVASGVYSGCSVILKPHLPTAMPLRMGYVAGSHLYGIDDASTHATTLANRSRDEARARLAEQQRQVDEREQSLARETKSLGCVLAESWPGEQRSAESHWHAAGSHPDVGHASACKCLACNAVSLVHI